MRQARCRTFNRNSVDHDELGRDLEPKGTPLKPGVSRARSISCDCVPASNSVVQHKIAEGITHADITLIARIVKNLLLES